MKKALIVSKFLLFLLFAAHAASATTVCMVGDSVVNNGGYWRDYMVQAKPFQYLGNYQDDYTYRHDGVGGDTTQDVLNRIDGYIDKDGNPVPPIPVCDITILHVGGNDLAKFKLWPADIAVNVRTIADKLAARGTTVYIGTILPCNNCGDLRLVANQYIAATNYHIKNAVSGVYTVLDHWKAITSSGLPASELYIDRYHPSDVGYRVLAEYDLSIITP